MSRQQRALSHVASMSGGAPVDPSLRVTLNFHPDRLVRGKPILEVLAEDGIYSSQFVTGTSNGGLTAYPGGDRWRWESRIFDGAYDDAAPDERPVYGALNFRRKPTGGAPRFGSAHFRLTAETLARATFCYPDSVFEPAHFGVAARMGLIELAEAHSEDELDDYVEAQVHGSVRLDRDVVALVLDPCYRGTPVEAAARALPCAVEWHPGFELAVDELRRHPDYRGQEHVDLGVEIAEGGRLDPRVIGDAARSGRHDLQALKRVWHCLARFGTLPLLAPLFLLAGAPGSGKTTLLPELVRGGLVVMDMDELLEDGALIGVPIAVPEAAAVWPAYDRMWGKIVAMVRRAGHPVLLLCPIPDAWELQPGARWEGPIRWGLLDIPDNLRVERLKGRGDQQEWIDDALEDAAQGRTLIQRVFDGTSEDTAPRIREWATDAD